MSYLVRIELMHSFFKYFEFIRYFFNMHQTELIMHWLLNKYTKIVDKYNKLYVFVGFFFKLSLVKSIDHHIQYDQ